MEINHYAPEVHRFILQMKFVPIITGYGWKPEEIYF
jgi:hypothetical protein